MDQLNFHIENIVREDGNALENFEGPLNLILMLVQKNRIEIRDLKISDILDQYLEYLDRYRSMDLEVASEFVQMASHLLYIKTKSVLSKDDENPELEFLITSLEQLKARDSYNEIKTVVPFFEETAKRGFLYYTKNAEPDPENSGAYSYNHKAIELLQALYDTFSRNDAAAVLPEAENVVPSKVIYSIKEKCSEILRNLISERSVNLAKLYGSCASRSELVATFVSILELCSLGNIQIRKYGNGYSVRYVSGDIGEILDSIAG